MRSNALKTFALAAIAAGLHWGLPELQPAPRAFEARRVVGVCPVGNIPVRNIVQLIQADIAVLTGIPPAINAQLREACRWEPKTAFMASRTLNLQ